MENSIIQRIAEIITSKGFSENSLLNKLDRIKELLISS